MNSTRDTPAGPGNRNPEQDRATLRAIRALAQQGELPRAVRDAEAALNGGLEHSFLHNLVALGREQAGDLHAAVVHLEHARHLEPANVGTLNALGLLFQRLARHDEAIECFDEVLRLDARFAPAHINRGVSLEAQRALGAAEASFERALALDPGSIQALGALAQLASRRGNHDVARSHAQAALAREPGYPPAVMALAAADIASGAATDAAARLERLIADPRVNALERAHATGLLGDCLDAQRDYAAAFAAYQRANAALKEFHAPEYGVGEDALAYAGRLEQYFAAAPAEAWARPAPEADTGPAIRAHVFLLGFTRSGTTLLEQVLASHPDVVALEERESLIDAVRSYMRQPADLDRLLTASAGDHLQARECYWRRVAAGGCDPQGKVFVDKYPMNTLKLPLIARLFPNARILFAIRDPRDVVLSCFRRHFEMNPVNYQLLTLSGAADFYAVTMRLAGRFQALLGLRTHVAVHEQLIADLALEAQAVCRFLDLSYTPAMLEFAARTRDRDIATPSGAQLARGLNPEGAGHWRNYRAQLAPVLPVLAPFAEAFGYPLK
jgi:tetratricopeptide (TPR) repeat protein